jgi:hypothetical protein
MDALLTFVSFQPHDPDGATQGGWGSMMEIAYVAHYVSQ